MHLDQGSTVVQEHIPTVLGQLLVKLNLFGQQNPNHRMLRHFLNPPNWFTSASIFCSSYALMLVAGQFANELVRRTFEEADRELEAFKERAGDFADFRALVTQFTEDPSGREKEGLIGWVTRGDPRVPGPLREAIFDHLDTGGAIPAGGVALGPVRMKTGCALLWLSKDREGPSWEVMSQKVHEELRRGLGEEVMPRQSGGLEERPASTPPPPTKTEKK